MTEVSPHLLPGYRRRAASIPGTWPRDTRTGRLQAGWTYGSSIFLQAARKTPLLEDREIRRLRACRTLLDNHILALVEDTQEALVSN